MSGVTRRTFVKGGAAMAAGLSLTTGLSETASAAGAAIKPITPDPAPHAPKIGAIVTAPAVTVGPRVGTVSATNTQLNGLTGWVVPSDWGAAWRTKLAAAKAGTGLAVAAMVGDSIGYGYWASNLLSTSWFEVLRTNLTSVGGYGGSGFQSQAHSPLVMYNPKSGVPTSYQSVPGNVWQQSAGWVPTVPPHIYGPGGGALQCTTTGALLFNYVIGTEVGIWYFDGGGDFSVQIDGQTVGTVHVGTSFLPAHVSFPAPNGKLAVHSWEITGSYNSTLANGTSICGVEGLNPTGVRLDNFAFPGLYSRYFANQDSPYYSGTYAGGFHNPADLVIYSLGAIDIAAGDPNYPSGTPADVWTQNVQGYMEGVMDTTFGGNSLGQTDTLFLFPMLSSAFDVRDLYLEYKARAIGMAQSYGAALLDLNALWHGSWNAWQQSGFAGNQTDPTKSGSDAVHPSDAGHAWIAAQLTPLLSALS